MTVDELYTVEIWLQHDTDYRDKTYLRLRILREDIGQVIDFIREVRKNTVGDAWYQIQIEGPTKEYVD